MRIVTRFLFLFFVCCVSAQAGMVGLTQFSLTDDPQRPLAVTIWYPTTQTTPRQKVADNIAFFGSEVSVDARPENTAHPLVLLSHGYRGNWKNQHWLATRLVEKGFVVAAVEHPGTTSRNTSPKQAAEWWQRPQDMTRLLNALLHRSPWQSVIDAKRIAAIGHSLGGWTVLQLAGAEVNRVEFEQHCQQSPGSVSCELRQELGLNETQPDKPQGLNLHETRIQKVVSLDLGLAHSFSLSSLRNVQIPVLVLAAGTDKGRLPQIQESGFLAEHLPLLLNRYRVYDQASHFSFLQSCKPGAITLLEAEVPGDGMICEDGPATQRSDLHQRFFEDIYAFLTQ